MEFLEQLTFEQREVAELFGKGQAVVAGAGSGKTSTLVAKCKLFLILYPKSRFCAVSFTEKSAQDLKLKLSKNIEDLSSHTVTTIHGLCTKIIHDFTHESGLKGDEEVLNEFEASELWQNAFDTLWESDVPGDVRDSFFVLMDRESITGIKSLIARVRECAHFGALESLKKTGVDLESKSLVSVSEFVISQYEALKRKKGFIDFNDLEKHALIALRNSHIQKHYRQYFDLVLVDEFQDTNALQGELISLFVRPQYTNLCVVGDPKQSIYRFRDADYSIFQDFQKACEKNHTLTINFRSRPSLIQFVNRVCDPLFNETGLDFLALHPHRQEGTDEGVFYSPLEKPEELVSFFKNKIKAGEDLSSYVILLRKMRGNEDWFKVLTQNGIPLSIGSGGFFWEDPKVKELVSFLKWWNEPLHQFSGAVFLKSPLMGFTENDFNKWLQSGKTLWDGFFESSHPLVKTLASYKGKSCRPGELLLSFLSSECSAQVENEYGLVFMRLWHKLETFSSDDKNFSQIVHILSSFVNDKKREVELPAPASSGQLRVLTVHGSKGLEFENVVLLDFWNQKERAKPAPLIYWDRNKGAYFSKRDESGERLKSDNEKFWKELEHSKELNETKRVFYVALTRAKERLFLFFPKDEPICLKPKDEPLKLDFWRAWVESSGLSHIKKIDQKQFAEPDLVYFKTVSTLETNHYNLGEQFIPKTYNHRPRMSVSEWAIYQKCELSYFWSILSPPEYIIQDENHNSMEDLGTLVHKCLENGDLSGLEEIKDTDFKIPLIIKNLESWISTSLLMRAKREGVERKILSEFSFEVNLHGQIFVGTMDRVIVDRNLGTNHCDVTLVDFKVTQKEKSESELLENYTPQMALYVNALRKLFKDDVGTFSIKVKIIAISSHSIREIDVNEAHLDINADQVLGIQSIVAGKKPDPKPSTFCFVCPWNKICPVKKLP